MSPCFDPEVATVDDALLEAHGFYYVKKPARSEKEFGCNGLGIHPKWKDTNFLASDVREGPGKQGAPCENKPTKPRANHHPTIKPIALFRHLVRLLVPPDGIVLDPFFGSGTTGIAAMLEDRKWVGIEMDKDYCRIAKARTKAWAAKTDDLLRGSG